MKENYQGYTNQGISGGTSPKKHQGNGPLHPVRILLPHNTVRTGEAA